MRTTTTIYRVVVLTTAVALSGCQFPVSKPKLDFNLFTWAPAKAPSPKPEPVPVPNAGQKVELQMSFGRSLERQGRLEEAIAIYEDVLKNDAHRIDAYQRLAVVNDQLGNFEESDKFFRTALKRDPKNAELLCDRGYSFYLQNRDAEAERCFRDALASNPRLARAHNNLALLLARNSRDEQALAEFAQGGSREADARVNLAFCMMARREWTTARQELARASAADPNAAAVGPALAYLRAKAPSEVAETVANVPTPKAAIANTASAPSVVPSVTPATPVASVTSYDAPQRAANGLSSMPAVAGVSQQVSSLDYAAPLQRAAATPQDRADSAKDASQPTARVLKLAITTGQSPAAPTQPANFDARIADARVAESAPQPKSEIRIVNHSTAVEVSRLPASGAGDIGWK
jgi:tetratricopeptide (TPR) repeat protein